MHCVKARSRLLPLLRSPFQGELLAWLYLHPDREYSATELATRFGVSQPTASREADRLAGVGLILERRLGNIRLLRANPDSPLARPLTDLLAATFGPAAIIGELLGEIDGIVEAYLYGSWAARFHGEPGGIPHEVDVLVVGEADDEDLDEVTQIAQNQLGHTVIIQRVSVDAWRNATGHPFLESVRSRPLVPLDLTRSA